MPATIPVDSSLSGHQVIDPAIVTEPLTDRRIRYRTDRLARIFGLSPEDREDLRQDLIVEVLAALPRYNASLASPETFAKGVMDRWYMTKARDIKRHRHTREATPLSDVGCDGVGVIDQRAHHVGVIEFWMDFAVVVARLPPDLRRLIEALRTMSVVEIAAAFGVHRGTVYRAIARLRACLVEFMEPVSV